MGKIAVNLPDDLEALLRERAAAKGWNFSDEIRSLLYQALGTDQRQEKIAETTERAIREGMTNAQVLAEIRRVHGEDRGSENTVAFYRSKLRKEDPSIMSDAQARADQY